MVKRRKISEPVVARPALGDSTAHRSLMRDWGPTMVRMILGLVFLWFGVQELLQPRLWTGYVPLASSDSGIALGLVLIHGGLLWLLATALILGIAPRAAALLGALALAEIILSIAFVHGLNDIVARDLGVLGLALAVLSSDRQRLLLAG
jgi:uncharacterized membrane protein YphA (DoxX/SURF4 family)